MLRNWLNEWNDIIRYIIWSDVQLKTLMKIPANASILDFVDKYFIRMGYTDETLSDQAVRIVYGEVGGGADIPHVMKQEMSFDIYVKKSELRNATNDRLQLRTHLIADRLNHLLTQKDNPHIGGYNFRVIGETEMGTSVVGYTRLNISFEFFRTI